MFGLRVKQSGSAAVILALPQERYLVSAGASIGRRRGQKGPAWRFQASGLDDNDDALRWLSSACPPIGARLSITIINSATATSPRRLPRRLFDWQNVFARQIEREKARLEVLEARLRQLAAGGIVAEQTWTGNSPPVALRVRVNDRDLGRLGVEQPGVLTVTVYAKTRGKQQVAALNISSGAQFGPRAWRWHDWSLANQRLAVADKLSLEVVEPRRLLPNTVRAVERDSATRASISAEIAEIRGRLHSKYYAEQETSMREHSRSRAKPHRYPRLA